MSDDKVRRVSLARQHFRLGEYFEKVKDDSNGTHFLTPVDEYVVIGRSKALEFLTRIERRGTTALELEITLLARELLAEIGGEDE